MRAVSVAFSAGLISACFFEPPRPNASHADAAGDGTGSGSGATPHVRYLHHAYWCNADGSPGMGQDHYAISTSGIADGDLVLFIANVDNGTNDTWVLPPGFSRLYGVYYDGGDGQAFVVGYKIVTSATGEGLGYSMPYGPGINSGCAVVQLVAVTGYDPANPFDAQTMSVGVTADNPVVLRGQLTTHIANDTLLLTGGADWLTGHGSNDVGGNVSYDAPGFDIIDAIADSGGLGFTWSSQLVATRIARTPGDTGVDDAHMTADKHITGTPWVVELAITPAP